MTDPVQPPASPAAAPARASLNIQALLAVMVSAVFAAGYIAAFWTKNIGLIHDLTEVLKALVYGVFGYYFGSSVGSRLKGAAGPGQPHG